MNTVTHVLSSTLITSYLTEENKKAYIFPAFMGGLLPDLHLIIIFSFFKIFGYSESYIWKQIYFSDEVQAINLLANSIPLAVAGLFITLLFKKMKWCCFFVFYLMHLIVDLFTHHSDAYLHFFPLSDIQYFSPLSYWDPERGALWLSSLELVIIILGLFNLFKSHIGIYMKAISTFLLLGYFAGVYQYFTWIQIF